MREYVIAQPDALAALPAPSPSPVSPSSIVPAVIGAVPIIRPVSVINRRADDVGSRTVADGRPNLIHFVLNDHRRTRRSPGRCHAEIPGDDVAILTVQGSRAPSIAALTDLDRGSLWNKG